MKKLFYFSIIILLTSCAGGQLFVEARTTYDIPLNNDGQFDKDQMDFQQGLRPFNPQVRLTYRHYIFDNKRYPKSRPYKLKK
tara:strand:- start:1740 stop:1985 length:246 start_codon:yes stop_codon:yes gene_type:complete